MILYKTVVFMGNGLVNKPFQNVGQKGWLWSQFGEMDVTWGDLEIFWMMFDHVKHVQG
jgi:hypothetical protein